MRKSRGVCIYDWFSLLGEPFKEEIGMEYQNNRSIWVTTYSGGRFYPFDQDPVDIKIEDIAHALALTCRFGGHTTRFYSVAEHCCRVSDILPNVDPVLPLYGLLHDAAEAYLGDVIGPLKHTSLMKEYRQLENTTLSTIFYAFGLPDPSPKEHKLIHEADTSMLVCEKKALLQTKDVWREEEDTLTPGLEGYYGWNADYAKEAFLERFDKLMKDYVLGAH